MRRFVRCWRGHSNCSKTRLIAYRRPQCPPVERCEGKTIRCPGGLPCHLQRGSWQSYRTVNSATQSSSHWANGQIFLRRFRCFDRDCSVDGWAALTSYPPRQREPAPDPNYCDGNNLRRRRREFFTSCFRVFMTRDAATFACRTQLIEPTRGERSALDCRAQLLEHKHVCPY